MMGSERNAESTSATKGDVDGIIPHALSDIFSLIRVREENYAATPHTSGNTSSWNVTVSYLEVSSTALQLYANLELFRQGPTITHAR